MRKKIKRVIAFIFVLMMFNIIGGNSYVSATVTNLVAKEGESNQKQDTSKKDATKKGDSKQDESMKAKSNKDTSKDIVDAINQNPELKTFSSAVKATGLESVLRDSGPMTVFAPNNNAFENLPKGTLEDLLKPENKEKLEKIISFHFMPGNVSSKDLKNSKDPQIKMFNGVNSNLEVKSGDLYINGAKIIVADIATKNGTIHIIDAVMLSEN